MLRARLWWCNGSPTCLVSGHALRHECEPICEGWTLLYVWMPRRCVDRWRACRAHQDGALCRHLPQDRGELPPDVHGGVQVQWGMAVDALRAEELTCGLERWDAAPSRSWRWAAAADARLHAVKRVCSTRAAVRAPAGAPRLRRRNLQPTGYKDCTFHRIIKGFMIQVSSQAACQANCLPWLQRRLQKQEPEASLPDRAVPGGQPARWPTHVDASSAARPW